MIDAIRTAAGHSVRLVSETLAGPRSNYYHAAKPTAAQLSDQGMAGLIESIFQTHQSRYGHRRIHHDLAATGHSWALSGSDA